MFVQEDGVASGLTRSIGAPGVGPQSWTIPSKQRVELGAVRGWAGAAAESAVAWVAVGVETAEEERGEDAPDEEGVIEGAVDKRSTNVTATTIAADEGRISGPRVEKDVSLCLRGVSTGGRSVVDTGRLRPKGGPLKPYRQGPFASAAPSGTAVVGGRSMDPIAGPRCVRTHYICRCI